MGDRRNIELKFGPEQPSIYLYSHYCGCDLARMLALALDSNRNRWSDPAYLARYIVTHIVAQDNASTDEYGWGLSPYPYITGDGHVDIVVNLAAQTVTIKRARTFLQFVSDKKGGEN